MLLIATKYDKIKSILSQGIEWINMLSAIYLITTLIFPFEYQKPAMYFYFITLALDIIINKRYKNVKWNNAKWTFVAMILFYLCIWIWHPFEDSNLPHFKSVYENRLPYIVFGLLGLFTNINPRLKLQYFAIPMLLISIGCTIYLIIIKFDIFNHLPISFIQYQKAFEYHRVTTMRNSHMSFNLYLNFSIMFSIYAIQKFKQKWLKGVTLLGLLLVYLILLVSEGRTGFLTGNILVLGFACYIITKNNKKLIVPLLSLAIIGILFIINNHSRTKDLPLNNDPRIGIWEHSMKIIKDEPIFGYGVSDGRKAFVEKMDPNENILTHYLKLHPDLKNTYKPHSHNTFIESTIEFGIIGLVLICLIFILPIIFTRGEKRVFTCILIFIFSLQSLFEILGPNLPNIYLCWFLYLFLTENKFFSQNNKTKAIEN